MSNDISIIIIGAGSYGTALAITLSRNGHAILLWGHNASYLKQMELDRCNKASLPGFTFPSSLYLESSLKVALSKCQDILIVVPSHVFGEVLTQIKPYLHSGARIAWATKGLEAKTGRLLQEVVKDVFGNKIPIAILSGPTFASELAAGLPTSIALAATDVTFIKDLQLLLNKNFQVYSTTDIIGVQIGGAVKNIIAIGTGISDGIGFGASARTAIISRGLTEMSDLGRKIGAKSSTFLGMAGLGDLILTCTDNKSRNRRFGILLGKGIDIYAAQKKIGQVVEGYHNTKEVLALSERYGVKMPITEQVYQVLYKNKNAYDAALTLLMTNT